ncbi:MAG TPA: hypothetical protein K8U77_04050 [Slackia equolifaciens]|uniref:Uncharacterized protein n=1 Tax=Slackia equolifaciens TaxID=498718 RepID=A0A9D2UW89_9ACTN|nr:hypothetical protein [Slackia equolifaciens]
MKDFLLGFMPVGLMLAGGAALAAWLTCGAPFASAAIGAAMAGFGLGWESNVGEED